MTKIGTLEATILIKIGDGEAFEVGALTLDVAGNTSLKYGEASIEVDSNSLKLELAAALEAGAEQLREGVRN